MRLSVTGLALPVAVSTTQASAGRRGVERIRAACEPSGDSASGGSAPVRCGREPRRQVRLRKIAPGLEVTETQAVVAVVVHEPGEYSSIGRRSNVVDVVRRLFDPFVAVRCEVVERKPAELAARVREHVEARAVRLPMGRKGRSRRRRAASARAFPRSRGRPGESTRRCCSGSRASAASNRPERIGPGRRTCPRRIPPASRRFRHPEPRPPCRTGCARSPRRRTSSRRVPTRRRRRSAGPAARRSACPASRDRRRACRADETRLRRGLRTARSGRPSATPRRHARSRR